MSRRRGKLLAAAAFYKNDKPGGIGIEFHARSAAAGAQFAAAAENALRIWDRHADAGDLFMRLEQLGAEDKGTLTSEEKWVTFINIYWLEQRGHLLRDEFNGVVWFTHWGRARGGRP